MDTLSKFTLPGIIFLLTLVSGVWLTQSGKPLNTAIFTIHKLIALAAVILTAIQIVGELKNTDVPVLPIALIILAGLCILALFATGAFCSLGVNFDNQKAPNPKIPAGHWRGFFILLTAFHPKKTTIQASKLRSSRKRCQFKS